MGFKSFILEHSGHRSKCTCSIKGAETYCDTTEDHRSFITAHMWSPRKSVTVHKIINLYEIRSKEDQNLVLSEVKRGKKLTLTNKPLSI